MKESNPFTTDSAHSSEPQPPRLSPALLKERLFSPEQDQQLLKHAKEIAEAFQSLDPDPEHPDWKPQAFIVGGFPRDVATGLHPKDIDLEVYGTAPERVEEVLQRLFPGKLTMKKDFGWHKIDLDDGLSIDVTIPRTEKKVGKGHTGFEILLDPSLTLKEAAQRRDFTINAIYADPMTGEFVDPTGGLKDLEEHVLRAVNLDHFSEDALRVYRAVQFAGRMELKIEPESLRVMQEMVKDHSIDEISFESIRAELEKLFLRSKKPSMGLEAMREIGLIKAHFPEFHQLVGLPQDPEWHPEGDAWKHSLIVTDQAAKLAHSTEHAGFTDSEKLQLVIGSFCHDLGKATTSEVSDDGHIRSIGHEEAGAEPAKAFCKRLVLSEELTHAIVMITTQHIKPNAFYRAYKKGDLKEQQYVNAVRRLLKSIHPMNWRVFLAACEADWRGSVVPGTDRGEDPTSATFIDAVTRFELDKAPTKPLLQGRDILELAKKKGAKVQGKRIGDLIKAVEAMRDDGSVTTYEQALSAVDGLIE